MASTSAPRFVKKSAADDPGGDRAKNNALKFANKALRSEAAMVDGQLLADFEAVLNGNAIYLPNFHCAARDYAVLASLAEEMERAVRMRRARRDERATDGLFLWRRRRAEEW